jgi:hypothetical protein
MGEIWLASHGIVRDERARVKRTGGVSKSSAVQK